MQQTISQAAQLYGKARSTIHRAIDSGRLSCSFRGDGVRVIDLAELIRLWGEPPNAPAQKQQNATAPEHDTQQAMLQELQALRREVEQLRADLRRLPPPSEQEPAKTPTQAPIDEKQDDDPHGLRELARALY
ncbi:MAG: hypothetical protein ABR539_11595, partial [Halomonas sp.]